ncbi:hypothetical protein BH09PLA1_BH09PLA1_13730 [soil metagenome]
MTQRATKRRSDEATKVKARFLVRYVGFGLLGCALFVGCADTNKGEPTTRPLTVRERHEAALKDPFSYGGDTENIDVSGGDTQTLDKKALKRDIDAVFNPQ